MSDPPADIRVLHVDDDAEFADLTREFLEREHDRLTVATAHDARAGLDRLAETDFDCVVSDFQMPGLDGLEFFEAVREDHPEVPFVLFTGEGSESIAADAVSAGVTDYLQKRSGTEQFALLANRIVKAVERADARRAVTETQERFRTLLSVSADYVIVVDADMSIEYVTPSIERVLGYGPADVMGDDITEYMHPEDRERVATELAELVGEPGAERLVELRAEDADGEWRWIEVTTRNLLDDPAVEGIVGNVRDVTERKEHEAAVDWHRTVIETMEEGVYVFDGDYEIRFLNYRVGEGDAPEVDLTGDSLAAFAEYGVLSEAEVASIQAGADRVLAGDADEVQIELEPAVPADTGTVELRLTPMRPDGEEPLVLGTTRDVSERIEREAALRRATERYRTLIDNFPNGGVFTFDEELRATLAGGDELDAVGLSPDDVEGARPRDLFPEDIAAELEEYYRAALDGEHHTFEQSYMGSHYRVHTLPIRDEDGEITAGLAVSQNVTDRVEHERELERQNERLDEFTSVVSHDLRNPLTVLAGAIEMAERTGEPEHFDRARRAVDRMEQLVDDLRTLAKQGDRVTDLEPVGLERVARASWQTVETPDAALRVETDQTVMADDTRLKQLFENCFGNAVEHAGPEVTVTVGDCDGGFYVADDGPGVPESEREAVFESGYSSADEGTGFGLAIVESIVEAHGWEIDLVESADGGARFEITGIETPE